MFFYFLNLPKDNPNLNFERNKGLSFAVMKTAEDALTPFYQYLRTAIKSLERKENVQAKWKKVEEKELIELQIIGSLYAIDKTSRIKLINNKEGFYKIKGNFEKDFDIPLIIWVNGQKKKIFLSEENFIDSDTFQLNEIYEEITKANWAGENIQIEPAWAVVKKGDIIKQEGQDFIVSSVNGDIIEVRGKLKQKRVTVNGKEFEINIEKVSSLSPDSKILKEEDSRWIVYSEKGGEPTNYKLFNLLNKEEIYFEDGNRFNGENTEKLFFRVPDASSLLNKKVIIDGVKFVIKKPKTNDKNAFWIQIEEFDEQQEDIPGFSPLKYFFDDDIIITDETGEKYAVIQGIESERKLILQPLNSDNKRKKYAFPKGQLLQVKVNTYQLRKQLEAVLTLQNMPVKEQARLIKLFERRDLVRWNEGEKISVDEWVVLTDPYRSGAKEQREFVEKALSTLDFAILEGPPGSGKTTVILEIICQLAQQGKRVLLCGSTHVAIDNVLERLKEKRSDGKNLLERFAIFPIRIGDEKRIGEDVREFQIDKVQEENKIPEELLLDTANLVCGTTIGILQHPKFKQRKARRNNMFEAPIIPEFDYLIIDESSKTTFQEFLVPALYAKKWILVGDVMQLAPFTDREQIVSNLENLLLREGKILPVNYQQALFYLHKLLEITKYANNKYVLPLEEEIIPNFREELEKRLEIEKRELVVEVFNPEKPNKLKYTAADILLINKNILDGNIEHLPETHAILRWENWEKSSHAYLHNYWQQRHKFKIRERGKPINNSFEIVERTNIYFKEKSWAEEITWRIEREHQLRLLGESKTKHYKKVIEELMPLNPMWNKKDIEERINNIAAIAFPSILESLIHGIKGRKTRNQTTISEGFTTEELRNRRSILKYQHRMHPEISKFPREQFYKNKNALLDLSKPSPIESLRQWNYHRYPHRSIWIDVKGKTIRNYNLKEAEKLIQELGEFINYASQNPQPEGKTWTVACLTFYKGQERIIREKLRQFTGKENAVSNFNIQRNGTKIHIKLHTVDKFQGQEADIVFLSMVQTRRDGFMDNPNRLNVAITRAKFQLVIIGDKEYFSEKSRSDDLKNLAINTSVYNDKNI